MTRGGACGRLPPVTLTDALPVWPRSSRRRGARWRSRSGFHIILASFGVAFPAMMLIANYRGLRKGDDATRCCSPGAGRRWWR